MLKPTMRPPSHDEPIRVQGRFTDREAKIWLAGQARRPKHERITVLLVSSLYEDHASLRQILAPPEFRLVSSQTASAAETILRNKRVAVVIAACSPNDGCWKDLRRVLQDLPECSRPRLVVTASETDDCFWAQMTDLGACDVLTTPFDPEEVVCSVRDAWLARRRQMEVEPEPRPKARTATA